MQSDPTHRPVVGVNIVKFGQSLGPGHKELKGAIARLRDLHSIHADLKMAHAFSGHLTSLLEEPDSPQVEDHSIALTCAAIVFYARATKARSNHRRGYDFRSRFDGHEKEMHGLITALRDDAIAHYGPGAIPDAPLFREDAIFLMEGSHRLATVSRQSSRNPKFTQRLDRHLHRTLMLAAEQLAGANLLVATMLTDQCGADESLAAQARSYEEGLAQFFGTEDRARTLMTPPDGTAGNGSG